MGRGERRLHSVRGKENERVEDGGRKKRRSE